MSLFFSFGMLLLFVVGVFVIGGVEGSVLVFFLKKAVKELMSLYMLQYLFITAQIRIRKLILNIRSVFESLSSLRFNPDEMLKLLLLSPPSIATLKMDTNTKLIMQTNLM